MGNDRKIEEAVANAKDNEDKAEDLWEKIKRLKREKMRQKRLLKAKKKARLKAKEVDDNKKAGNNKNAGDDKDASPFAPTVAASPGLPTPIAAFLGFLAPVPASFGRLTPISVNLSLANSTGVCVAVCPSLFSFLVWPSLFSFPACHTTPISFSPMRVLKSTSLPLKDDYVV